jgi:sodium transport system permease protein
VFQSILCILEKEIRYAVRDTDVLIYSVVVPLVVYPLFILGSGEVMLWQMTSSQQYKIYLDKVHIPPYLDKALHGVKGLKFEQSADPTGDLKKGKLDIVISGSESSDKYNFLCTVGSKRGYMGANSIRTALTSAQVNEQVRIYHEHRVPIEMLTVFSADQSRLVPVSPHHGAVEKNSPIALMAAVMIGLMQAGLVAGVAAVCMFAEEREKKTYETTVSLPVSGYELTAGKWLAATVLTIGSAILYILSVAASYSVVLFQIISTQKISPDEVNKLIAAEPVSILLAVLTVILGSGVACAMCMLCVSSCKTFKDAQAISMYPMCIIVSLPMLALIPGIEQHFWINLIPLTNTLVALKHPQSSLFNLLFGVVESLAITVGCLFIATRIFFSEKAMFATVGKNSIKTSQQQSESV